MTLAFVYLVSCVMRGHCQDGSVRMVKVPGFTTVPPCQFDKWVNELMALAPRKQKWKGLTEDSNGQLSSDGVQRAGPCVLREEQE